MTKTETQYLLFRFEFMTLARYAITILWESPSAPSPFVCRDHFIPNNIHFMEEGLFDRFRRVRIPHLTQ